MKAKCIRKLCMLLAICCVFGLCACEKEAELTGTSKGVGATRQDPVGTTNGSGEDFLPSTEWTIVPDSYLIFELNDEGTGYKCLGFQDQSKWENQQYIEKYPYCVIPDTFNGLPVLQVSGGWGWEVAIKGVAVPASVTMLHSQVFGGMETLESAKLPGSVTELADGIFMGCANLEEVILEEGIEYLGGQCFQNCTSLKRITLPKSLKSISMKEFAGCTALEEIVLQEGLTNIARNAFDGCTSLTQITIPSTVTAFGKGVFSGCTALQEISFLGSVEQWNELNVSDIPAGCVVHCSDGDV